MIVIFVTEMPAIVKAEEIIVKSSNYCTKKPSFTVINSLVLLKNLGISSQYLFIVSF